MTALSITHRPEIPYTIYDRCPGNCANEVSAQLQVLADRVSAIVTLPRLMLICQTCQRTFVVAPSLAGKAAA
jgi:hypothetical protein